MKKRLFLLILVLMTLTASAQQKAKTFAVTPKAGVAVSNFSGNMPVTITYAYIQNKPELHTDLRPVDESTMTQAMCYTFNGTKNKVGFTIGAEGQYQFTPVFGLSLGAFYTQEGTTYKTIRNPFETDEMKMSINDDLRINLNCITLPVLANVYVWKGLAFKAGFQPEFSVGKKTKCDIKIEHKTPVYLQALGTDVNIKSFSLSLPIGVSYEYKHVVADLRYCFGLTDLHKKGDSGRNGNFSAYNRVLSFTLGYKFP